MTQTPWRVLGGPLGAHASPRLRSVAGWARLAVVLSAVPVLAALALRGWCLSNGFGGQAPLWRACYSDLPAALAAHASGGDVGEPVVLASALSAVAAVVPGGSGATTAYVLAWALVSLLALAVLAAATAAYRSDAPDRALLLVLSPVLPLTLLISADIVGVTLAVLGLVAWRRRLDVPAGVLLALAVLSRGHALILVVAVLALTLKTGRDPRRFLLGLGAGLVAVTGLAATRDVGLVLDQARRSWEAVPSYGSIWLVPQVGGAPLPSGLTPWLAVLGLVVAAVFVGWLAWRAPVAPDVADLALLGLAVVLVMAPSVPVQASLWLVPLVALSSVSWRDKLIWAGAEAMYYPMVWLYIGGLEQPDRGLPLGWYAFFLLLRLLAIAYLGVRVVEQAGVEPAVVGAATVERLDRMVIRMLVSLLVITALLGALLTAAFFGQRQLVFHPEGDGPGSLTSAAPGVAGQDVRLEVDGRLELRTWLLTPTGVDRDVAVLYLPGNGGDRGDRLEVGRALAAEGMTVLLMDYRGFGGNPGSPSEDGLVADAQAGAAFLRSMGFEAERTLYVGESIGTGVAARLAVTDAPAGILLRSPFTSLTDVASAHYPRALVRLVLRDRFESAQHLAGSQVPVSVLYGAADEVVPASSSAALAAAVGNLHEEVVVPDVGHNDPIWFGEFLAGHVASLADAVVVG